MSRCQSFAAILTMVGSLVTATIGSAAAQEASPAAGTPAAELVPCTAEPHDIDETLALWFGPGGEPAATPTQTEAFADIEGLPDGAPADDATVEAIIETTGGFISCMRVARQFPRGFSYVTDNLLAQFGPDTSNPLQDAPDEVRAALAAQLAATPAASAESAFRMPPFAGPRRTRLLEDGRVGAIWSFGGDKVFFVYVLDGDRWLIDDAIDILEVEAAATPSP